MDFPVTLKPDISLHSVFMAPHDYVSSSTGIPAPAPAGWDLEPVLNMWWPPGVLFAKAKFTTNVWHKSLNMVLEGHDIGPMMPHAPLIPAPDNLLTMILHMLKSSRKIMFSAGEVLAEGTPIGCVTVWPVTPMLTCANPVPLPLSFSPTNFMNTVRVGLTWWDLVGGWLAIAVEILRSAFRSGGGGGGGNPIAGAITGGPNDLAESPVDSLLSGANACALVRGIGRLTGDFHGPVTFSIKQGQGMLAERSAQLTIDDEGYQVQAGVEGLNGLVSGGLTGRRNDDGTTSVAHQEGLAGMSTGDQNIRRTEDAPGGGRRTVWF